MRNTHYAHQRFAFPCAVILCTFALLFATLAGAALAGDAPVTLSTMIYDTAGRVHTSTAARENVTTNVYDDIGRRIRTIDALGQARG